jgi:hypothetical protein
VALVLGRDDVAFAVGSDGLPGVERTFSRLSEAAEEAGQSRIYGGIHWQYDNQDGLRAGRELGTAVVATFLRRRPAREPRVGDALATQPLGTHTQQRSDGLTM